MAEHEPAEEKEDWETLCQDWLRGEGRMVEKVIQHLQSRLFWYIRKRFGDSLTLQDCEDITDESLLRLWRFREHFDSARGPVQTWVAIIARNLAIDLVRKKARFKRIVSAPENVPYQRVEEESPRRSSALLQELHQILEELPQRDRDILLTFAAKGGEEAWASELAAALGCSANAVRIRKSRLINQLRQRLLPVVEDQRREGVTTMRDQGDLLALFSGFKPQLREIAALLANGCELARKGHSDPAAVFARVWNASRKDRSLTDPAYRENLQRRWCQLQALLQFGNDYREKVKGFWLRHRGDDRLRQSELLAGSAEAAVERIEQGILGLSNEIEDRMPEGLIEKGKGEVGIAWEKRHDGLDGRCTWEGGEKSTPLVLRTAARSAFREEAELASGESEVWADLLLEELCSGKLDLPDFKRLKENADYTRLLWQPEDVEPLPLAQAPPEEQQLSEANECSLPLPIEVDLWKDFQPVAEALDKALTEAALRDYRNGSQESGVAQEGREGAAVDQVVGVLHELTGRPVHELALLLTPLLVRRLEDEGHSSVRGAAYLAALRFLEAQIT